MQCTDCGSLLPDTVVECVACGSKLEGSVPVPTPHDAYFATLPPRPGPPPPHDESWICPRCSESIEGQFTSCWKCAEEGVPPAASPGTPPLKEAPDRAELEILVAAAFRCSCGRAGGCRLEWPSTHRIELVCLACGRVRTYDPMLWWERIAELPREAAVRWLAEVIAS